MGPKTQPYRNQHAELRRLAAAVAPSGPVHPERAHRALACVRALLVVHAGLQDGMLYPWMLRHNVAKVRATARSCRRAMRAYLRTFNDFFVTWNDAAIERDPSGFTAGWRLVSALLLYRLEAEASVLYPAVEQDYRPVKDSLSGARVCAA